MSSTLNSTSHPKALWLLSFCYSLYMWSFASIMTALTLYIAHTPNTSMRQAYAIYAVFSSLLWVLPLAGGYLSEKIGYMKTSFAGLVICFISMVLMSLNHSGLLFAALSLFLIGNALFTPSLWCVVDHLYHKVDNRRESGFTLFYLIFNVGVVFGTAISNNIGHHFGYSISFAINALIIALCVPLLILARSQLKIAGNRSIKGQYRASSSKHLGVILVFTLILLGLIIALFRHPSFANPLTLIVGIGTLLYLLYLAKQQPTATGRNHILGFTLLCIFALGFWSLYNLEPSLISVFIEHSVNKKLLGFQLSADSFFAFEPFFIVVIGLLLSRLWFFLAKRGKDFNLALKFAIALLLIGLGFLFLKFSMQAVGYENKLPIYCIIPAYAIFAAGELFIGPLGISMVGMLSAPGKEGILMGVWQLIIGISAIISGGLANLSIAPKHANFIQAQALYSKLFSELGWIILACGLLVLISSHWVKQLLLPEK